MPPSHRSSGSSHRSSGSSHRSSSHSSSSHRSSSHSSSSHRSSYSSSRSSYSGASGAGLAGSSFATGHSNSAASRAVNNRNLTSSDLRGSYSALKAGREMVAARAKAARPRVHQPAGYNRTVAGYVDARMHRCKHHDYVYYPVAWTDNQNVYHEKGYYDEEGQYYEAIAFYNKDSGKYESKFECKYCGTEIKAEWEKGAAPDCPNCGANLTEVITGIVYEEETESYFMPDLSVTPEEEKRLKAEENRYKNKRLVSVLPVIIMVVMFFVSCACCGCLSPFLERIESGLDNVTDKLENVSNTLDDASAKLEGYDNNQNVINNPSVGDGILSASDAYLYGYDINERDMIFVEEIGRNCEWDNYEECYYDPATACYFWYNAYLDEPCWQYWYDSVSEDFAEAGGGWMEYDEYEGVWYVEYEANEWDVLPDYYNSYNLWHIKE